MCGRFTLTADVNTLQNTFPWLNVPGDLQPRYNIAPSQPIAVVPNDGKNQLDFYVWGLIPFWAKDPSIGYRMINARSETLAEKPSFKNAFKRRRCLVLADGFYEWRKEGAGKPKTPMYIQLESKETFAFAGLWENWNAPDGSQVLSCTIITTHPNTLVEKIHNRMPVILPADGYSTWLEPSEQNPEVLSELLEPYPASEMMAYPVSTSVNSPINESPDCIEPVR